MGCSAFLLHAPKLFVILCIFCDMLTLLLYNVQCSSPTIALCLSAASSACLGVAAPVSVAPPPPPMVQLTPQIPLTGFVARMQESSK